MSLSINEIAAELNRRAPEFRIGGLQDLRVELKELQRRPTRQLFTSQTTFPEWAFHHGGRSELQFNIGIEYEGNQPYFRHGVAFSLEPSQSLPDIEVLTPKIALFNEYVSQNSELFLDLKMWHFQNNVRSDERRPAPIAPALITAQAFIFLGIRDPAVQIDFAQILSDFDLLLPLYLFVESGGKQTHHPPLTSGFQFRSAQRPKIFQTVSTRVELELIVSLRHTALLLALERELIEEYGGDHVAIECPNGIGGRVDAVVEVPHGLVFYEVKVGHSSQYCIREAIGQLLEYSLWPGTQRACRLVVVGEGQLSPEGEKYLVRLNELSKFLISYRTLVLA